MAVKVLSVTRRNSVAENGRRIGLVRAMCIGHANAGCGLPLHTEPPRAGCTEPPDSGYIGFAEVDCKELAEIGCTDFEKIPVKVAEMTAGTSPIAGIRSSSLRGNATSLPGIQRSVKWPSTKRRASHYCACLWSNEEGTQT